jgi:hypothetical protein
MSRQRWAKSGVPMLGLTMFGRMPGYRRSMQMLASLRKFTADEVAQERWKIMQFYAEHGEAETRKYFGVNRKTIHVWKKRLASCGQRLEALGARSTRPQRVRRMTTDVQVLAFIRQLREEHPRLGKEKIKPLLDRHCLERGIHSPAVSTIGKIIKRHGLYFQRAGRVYHDPNSHWARNAGQKRPARLRVRYAPHPQEWGHFQLDTMVRQLDWLKLYFYSAIDVQTKVAFSLPYSRLSSRHAKEFLESPAEMVPAAHPGGADRQWGGVRRPIRRLSPHPARPSSLELSTLPTHQRLCRALPAHPGRRVHPGTRRFGPPAQ